MNILFVTQQDPFYIPIFFQEFFRLYKQQEEEIEIQGVVIQPSLGKNSKLTLLQQIWGLYGSVNFLRQAGRYITKKFNYALYGLGLKEEVLATPALFRNYNLDILPYTDVNASEFIEFVENEGIDLVVSVSATQIFSKELLAAPRQECINIHSSPLPEYRGMMPNFWQMYHDEDYSVLTIHRMAEEVDKGEIIYQRKTEIKPDMTLEELVCEVKVNAARALWKVLEQYVSGKVEYTPVPDEEGSYFSFPTKQDAEEFRARGNQLL